MITGKTEVRVRYVEIDQMGIAYHGVYAQYLEVGRVELLRSMGYSYKKVEEEGILMAIVHLSIDYLRPIVYDELLTIHTVIVPEKDSSKISFEQQIFNEGGKLTTKAFVTTVCLCKQSRKKTEIPPFLKEKFNLS